MFLFSLPLLLLLENLLSFLPGLQFLEFLLFKLLLTCLLGLLLTVLVKTLAFSLFAEVFLLLGADFSLPASCWYLTQEFRLLFSLVFQGFSQRRPFLFVLFDG